MRSALGVVTLGLLTGAVMVAGPAFAQQPIGPHQHFIGLVNGSNVAPVVKTICPGPVTSGRKGPVAAGQTLLVANVSGGAGYTGPFSQVFAWFVPATAGQRPASLAFARYGQPTPIPTSVRVPCQGSGVVEFSSCPYLAPCAAGWVPDYVKVRFVNIAF